MRKLRSLLLTGALALTAVGFVGAAPASAAPCGYYNNGLPRYNHCGSGNVKIRVDNLFGYETWCVGPGVTTLGIPMGNRVKNAYYIGSC